MDSTQLKLYHFNISTGIETEIDIDPSNSSGDNKSRDHIIQSVWHDRDNSIIYGVDCDNDGNADDYDVWKLDYSISQTSPTITEIGSSIGADNNTVYAYDIFMIGTDVFVVNYETQIGIGYLIVREVDSAPFTEEDTQSMVGYPDPAPGIWYMGLIIGNTYHSFWGLQGDANGIYGFNYDDSITTISIESNITNYVVETDNQFLGIAYDNNNLLYFVAEKTADNLTYLISYSISGDSYSILGRYDIALMSERNNDSSASLPFNTEKGFHVSKDKIYQIPSSYTGRLNWISNYDFEDTIKAITDHFVIDDSGNVYEMQDLIGSVFRTEIIHARQDYSTMKMKYNSDNITIVPQMFIQIIGSHTVDGSTSSNQVIFEGIAQNPTEGRIRFVLVVNQASEIDKVKAKGSKSGRTDQIISDINDDGAPNGPSYVQDGTLTAGTAMGDQEVDGKKLRTLYDDYAENDAFTWSLRPQGQLDYNNGSIDSGADLRFDGSTYTDIITKLMAWKVAKKNQIIVNGAIDPSDGDPFTGQWDDEEDQQASGINSITIEDASLNSDALCQSKADTLGASETEITRVKFKYRKTTYGLIQPGQTITFLFDVSNYITISEAQFIVDYVNYELISETGYMMISSAV